MSLIFWYVLVNTLLKIKGDACDEKLIKFDDFDCFFFYDAVVSFQDKVKIFHKMSKVKHPIRLFCCTSPPRMKEAGITSFVLKNTMTTNGLNGKNNFKGYLYELTAASKAASREFELAWYEENRFLMEDEEQKKVVKLVSETVELDVKDRKFSRKRKAVQSESDQHYEAAETEVLKRGRGRPSSKVEIHSPAVPIKSDPVAVKLAPVSEPPRKVFKHPERVRSSRCSNIYYAAKAFLPVDSNVQVARNGAELDSNDPGVPWNTLFTGNEMEQIGTSLYTFLAKFRMNEDYLFEPFDFTMPIEIHFGSDKLRIQPPLHPK